MIDSAKMSFKFCSVKIFRDIFESTLTDLTDVGALTTYLFNKIFLHSLTGSENGLISFTK